MRRVRSHRNRQAQSEWQTGWSLGRFYGADVVEGTQRGRRRREWLVGCWDFVDPDGQRVIQSTGGGAEQHSPDGFEDAVVGQLPGGLKRGHWRQFLFEVDGPPVNVITVGTSNRVPAVENNCGPEAFAAQPISCDEFRDLAPRVRTSGITLEPVHRTLICLGVDDVCPRRPHEQNVTRQGHRAREARRSGSENVTAGELGDRGPLAGRVRVTPEDVYGSESGGDTERVGPLGDGDGVTVDRNPASEVVVRRPARLLGA